MPFYIFNKGFDGEQGVHKVNSISRKFNLRSWNEFDCNGKYSAK